MKTVYRERCDWRLCLWRTQGSTEEFIFSEYSRQIAVTIHYFPWRKGLISTVKRWGVGRGYTGRSLGRGRSPFPSWKFARKLCH